MPEPLVHLWRPVTLSLQLLGDVPWWRLASPLCTGTRERIVFRRQEATCPACLGASEEKERA